MAHLTGFWHEFMAGTGNVPGVQLGDVVIHFSAPVEDHDSMRCPTDGVTLAVEAGNFIGLMTTLPDGRSLFVPAGNVAGIIDAPADKPARASRRSAGAGDDPDVGEVDGGDTAGSAAHDKAEAAHDKSEAAEDKAAAQRRRAGR